MLKYTWNIPTDRPFPRPIKSESLRVCLRHIFLKYSEAATFWQKFLNPITFHSSVLCSRFHPPQEHPCHLASLESCRYMVVCRYPTQGPLPSISSSPSLTHPWDSPSLPCCCRPHTLCDSKSQALLSWWPPSQLRTPSRKSLVCCSCYQHGPSLE